MALLPLVLFGVLFGVLLPAFGRNPVWDQALELITDADLEGVGCYGVAKPNLPRRIGGHQAGGEAAGNRRLG